MDDQACVLLKMAMELVVDGRDAEAMDLLRAAARLNRAEQPADAPSSSEDATPPPSEYRQEWFRRKREGPEEFLVIKQPPGPTRKSPFSDHASIGVVRAVITRLTALGNGGTFSARGLASEVEASAAGLEYRVRVVVKWLLAHGLVIKRTVNSRRVPFKVVAQDLARDWEIAWSHTRIETDSGL